MSKVFTDADVKMEILIRLAFGYSYENVAEAYGYPVNTIINLRKNNYKVYNSIVDQFRIIREVAECGLPPVPERAVNIVKKFYNKRFQILTECTFLFDGEPITLLKVIDLANQIIALDSLPPLDKKVIVRNYYWYEPKTKGRKKK